MFPTAFLSPAIGNPAAFVEKLNAVSARLGEIGHRRQVERPLVRLAMRQSMCDDLRRFPIDPTGDFDGLSCSNRPAEQRAGPPARPGPAVCPEALPPRRRTRT